MKGDLITLAIVNGSDKLRFEAIEATKAGRRVVRKTSSGKVKWVEVNEVTRHGREVGNRLVVRLDAIVSIRETTAAEPG